MRRVAAVARLDLAFRRRSMAGYAVGLALYTLVVVALYPAFKDSSGLDKLTKDNPTLSALFGVSGSITSPDGWLNANLYQNLVPLVILLLTIGYGAWALAGQDEEGTLALVATLPLRRRDLVLGKTGTMAVLGAVLVATLAASVAVGRAFDLGVPAGNVVTVSIATLLLGMDLGLLAMAVGAGTGRRGTAIGVASAVAVASYLLSSLAPVISWLKPARYASIFYWAVGDNQIGNGVTVADAAVLVGVGAVALAATLLAFRRLDLH